MGGSGQVELRGQGQVEGEGGKVRRVSVGGVSHHAKLESEGWSDECGRSGPSRQIVKPARRRRTRVAEENVLGACPFVHVRVCAE